MKVVKHNVLNPADSEDLGSDARIRFYFSEDDYVEIWWEKGSYALKVTKQSFSSQIIIIPVVSNSIELR